MPTVSPAIAAVQVSGGSTPRLSWSGIITGDTINAFGVAGQGGVRGSVQIGGTFGGATVTLEGSNDGTTYFTLKALDNSTNISATAAAYFEFSTAALYIRPAVAGGSANSINVTVVLRG
jgi:hypothetical protein